ncbi:MAG: hypothetical protein ACK55Z_22670 [bacterium]
MAAKLTTMVYLFHLHDSVMMLYTPRWFTFSIYTIETLLRTALRVEGTSSKRFSDRGARATIQ